MRRRDRRWGHAKGLEEGHKKNEQRAVFRGKARKEDHVSRELPEKWHSEREESRRGERRPE